MARARELQVGVPAMVSSDYINTIPPELEPWFPGDEHVERRIRAFIRWNAVAMVTRANRRYDGLGGHLSTYASSASLYEVGFNHFFHGKSDGGYGDQIFIQGHAAPGVYARAFLEGRLTEEQLDHFRREVGGRGPGGGPGVRGLPSYPHPRRMPDFWEFPTVSMGLGPLNTRPVSTATCSTARSPIPAGPRSGASSETARWTSRSPWPPCIWPPPSSSTT
jgi:pyruvate dehydrogenase E1 component